jgi:hypothetical protein
LGGLREIGSLGVYEIAARMLMLVVAFVPILAFGGTGRIVGADGLAAMFFTRRATSEAIQPADQPFR